MQSTYNIYKDTQERFEIDRNFVLYTLESTIWAMRHYNLTNQSLMLFLE